MNFSRRGFIAGLSSILTAPAIVHAGNLMPVRVLRSDVWVYTFVPAMNLPLPNVLVDTPLHDGFVPPSINISKHSVACGETDLIIGSSAFGGTIIGNPATLTIREQYAQAIGQIDYVDPLRAQVGSRLTHVLGANICPPLWRFKA